MVQKENLEGKIVYKCEQCGWLYKKRGLAEKCQAWCEKHKSCNLEIAKFAIKLKG